MHNARRPVSYQQKNMNHRKHPPRFNPLECPQ